MREGFHTGTAPGRLDVMGGISDYSGSLLLQMPVAPVINATLRLRTDGLWRLHSRNPAGMPVTFEMHRDAIAGLAPGAAGALVRAKEQGDWAAYVIGCFHILSLRKGLGPFGADVEITSDLPWGKGLSSSAALETAVLIALTEAAGIRLEGFELPLLAQEVENRFVGAACGLMDQLAVHLGRKDHLLPIVCQPHEVMEPVPIPADIRFAGIDSGVRHAVGEAAYSDVRAAAFMAYSVIAASMGVGAGMLEHARRTGERARLPYGGYLSNIPWEEFRDSFLPLLPESMDGGDFERRYGPSIDTAAPVVGGRLYRLRACAAHPVREQRRVSLFLEGMTALGSASDRFILLSEIGGLMYGSHEGYSSVGLGHPDTDAIVAEARAMGPQSGIFGARVGGGGNGGTVVVMAGGADAGESLRILQARVEAVLGRACPVFSGSGEGAARRRAR